VVVSYLSVTNTHTASPETTSRGLHPGSWGSTPCPAATWRGQEGRGENTETVGHQRGGAVQAKGQYTRLIICIVFISILHPNNTFGAFLSVFH